MLRMSAGAGLTVRHGSCEVGQVGGPARPPRCPTTERARKRPCFAVVPGRATIREEADVPAHQPWHLLRSSRRQRRRRPDGGASGRAGSPPRSCRRPCGWVWTARSTLGFPTTGLSIWSRGWATRGRGSSRPRSTISSSTGGRPSDRSGCPQHPFADQVPGWSAADARDSPKRPVGTPGTGELAAQSFAKKGWITRGVADLCLGGLRTPPNSLVISCCCSYDLGWFRMTSTHVRD